MAVVPNLVLDIRTYAVTSAQRYINWFCIPTGDNNSQPAWYSNSDTFIIRTLNNNLQRELLRNLRKVVLYNGNEEWSRRLISQEVNWPHIPSEVKGFWERTKCKKITIQLIRWPIAKNSRIMCFVWATYPLHFRLLPWRWWWSQS